MVLALVMLPAAMGIVAMCAFVADYSEDMRVLGAAMGLTAVSGTCNSWFWFYLYHCRYRC